jgi:hypothetical protein
MNKIIGIIIGIVIIGAGAFWGGMTYTQGQTPARSGQFTQGGNRGGGRFLNGGGAFGTIIAKDATSITIQLGGPSATSTNGNASGTKIVLYDNSTQVGKFVTGSPADLSVGQMVSVGGTPNSDGSITAQMIQIRPANMPRSQGGQ